MMVSALLVLISSSDSENTLPCAMLDLSKFISMKALYIISVWFNLKLKFLFSDIRFAKILKMVLKYSFVTIISF